MAHSLTHPNAAADAERRNVERLLFKEEVRQQMGSPEGRRFVFRLIEAARCDGLTPLSHSVATIQAQITGVYDFVRAHINEPLEEFCPDLAEKMRNEARVRKAHDRNGSGSTTN